MSDILTEHSIDTVLHLAAQTSVDHSFKDPSVFTQVNVVGTQRMLESCRKSPSLRLFLFCSTDEVCGEVAEDAVTEDCPMKPTNPYSASKAAAELLVQGYAKSFQLPCIVTRCVNVYGGRQFPEKVIPKFIMRCRRGEPCCVHGDGEARRSFLYVEDVAEAFDLIMHQGKVGNIYNIGSRDCISVRDIADKICAATGQPGNIETVPDRLYNDCRSCPAPPHSPPCSLACLGCLLPVTRGGLGAFAVARPAQGWRVDVGCGRVPVCLITGSGCWAEQVRAELQQVRAAGLATAHIL